MVPRAQLGDTFWPSAGFAGRNGLPRVKFRLSVFFKYLLSLFILFLNFLNLIYSSHFFFLLFSIRIFFTSDSSNPIIPLFFNVICTLSSMASHLCFYICFNRIFPSIAYFFQFHHTYFHQSHLFFYRIFTSIASFLQSHLFFNRIYNGSFIFNCISIASCLLSHPPAVASASVASPSV